jgi:hypothetical protein
MPLDRRRFLEMAGVGALAASLPRHALAGETAASEACGPHHPHRHRPGRARARPYRLDYDLQRPVPRAVDPWLASPSARSALIGNVKVTWSFSAFTVLIYYAITNFAALRLPKEKRLYSSLFAWGGLVACLLLAFFVERQIWLVGLGLIATGLLWHALARYLARP